MPEYLPDIDLSSTEWRVAIHSCLTKWTFGKHAILRGVLIPGMYESCGFCVLTADIKRRCRHWPDGVSSCAVCPLYDAPGCANEFTRFVQKAALVGEPGFISTKSRELLAGLAQDLIDRLKELDAEGNAEYPIWGDWIGDQEWAGQDLRDAYPTGTVDDTDRYPNDPDAKWPGEKEE